MTIAIATTSTYIAGDGFTRDTEVIEWQRLVANEGGRRVDASLIAEKTTFFNLEIGPGANRVKSPRCLTLRG